MALLDKYTGVIDKAIALLEEYAKTTETTLDDTAAAVARAIFSRFLSGGVTEMAMLVDEKSMLLPILLGSPALFEFIKTILGLFRKG